MHCQTLITITIALALSALISGARADSVVVFNEVMYHPSSSEPSLEWLEMHNLQAVDVDISGWRLSNGVDYSFPAGTRLPGRGYLVVAVNPGALMAATPGLTGVLGPFTGRLSNSGEKLVLTDNSGYDVDTMDYGTDDAWPASADGAGTSLAKRAATLASARPESWTQSAQVGGTPGAANFPGPAAAAISIHEIGPAGPGFFVELLNHGTSPVNIGGMVLKRYHGGAVSYTLPAQILGAGQFTVITAEQIGAETIAGNRYALMNPAQSQVLDAVSVAGVARARLAPQSEWAFPHASTPGASNTFSLHSEMVINEIFYHGRATLPRQAVTQATTPVPIVGTWKYHQGGVDLGTNWRLAGYDDSAWPSGAALLASSGGAGSYSSAVLADSPAAYWKLDDASATIADASGNNRTGTATVGVTLGSTALVAAEAGSKAITLSGTNRITFPGFEKIGAGGYAVEFWVKMINAPSGFMNLVGDGESGGDFFLMNYLTAGRLLRPHYGTTNSPVSQDSNAALQVGQTYHVVTTWDTGPATNNATIFINGAADRTATVSRNVPAAGTTGNNTIFIGYDNREPASGSYLVDEVAIYHHPLTPARVAAHYQAGLAPGPRNTVLTAGPSIHYFRKTFSFAGDPADTALTLNLAVDDGAIVWLNGQELHRHNMPGGVVDFTTPANSDVAAPAFTGTFSVPAEALLNGTNVLAVEVHQSTVTNDVLFGLELTAIETLVPGNPYLESDEQWVELYNRSAGPVDLTDWQLDNGIDFDFPAGTIVQPGAFLVVAKDPAVLLAKYPGMAVVGPFNNSLGRRRDKIVLKDPAGNKADSVEYFDGGAWSSLADGGGSSLELRDFRADNSLPGAWAPSDEAARQSWQTHTYRRVATADGGPTQWNEFVLGLLDAGECLVDDISVVESPATAPVQKLTNGNFSSGAAGWRFLGTHKTSAVEPEPGNPGNSVLHVRATGAMEHMHNHIEATYTGNSPIVNGREYEISFRAKVIGGSRQLHTRLYHNRCARTTPLEVSPLGGTPGAINSRAAANIGPGLQNLRHAPAVPAANAPVTVSVEANDPDGVTAATLFYSVNGGVTQSAPMTHSTGVWSAIIPGQSAGAMAQFYVRAADGLGATADLPAAGPNSRALIIWNDSLANLPLAHNFRLLLAPADRTAMFVNTELMSNALIRGTVVYDESEVFYNVGVRLKGSERGRVTDNRISYHVAFDPAQPFRGVQESVAVDRSGGWRFGATFGQDEILVKHLINAAGGVSSQYDDITRLIVPGTAHTGSALLQMARYGDDYLDAAYQDGSDGALYKMELIYYPTTANGSGFKLPDPDVVIGADLNDKGPDQEAYRWFLLNENQTQRDDWTAAIALSQALSRSGAQLDAATAPLIEGSQWARCFALQTLCGIGDAYTRGNNHNLFFYQRPKDGRILALPWDWDFSFFQGTTASIFGDSAAYTVLQRPQYLRLYYAHLRELCDTVFNTGYMSYWTNHYDNFCPGQNFSSILTYIGDRRTYVLNQLPSQASLTLNGAPANGTITSATSLPLSGTAPWSAASVQLSGPGGVVEVTFSTIGNWSATMPLLLGSNTVTLSTYDVQGALITSQNFTVISTATTGFVDADLDGLPDAWEATHGLGGMPLAAATSDRDGDGQSNLAEYLAGTDPNDVSSFFRISSIEREGDELVLQFPTEAGRNYRLQANDAFPGGVWQTLATFPPAATGSNVEFSDTPPANTPRRTYRVATP